MSAPPRRSHLSRKAILPSPRNKIIALLVAGIITCSILPVYFPAQSESGSASAKNQSKPEVVPGELLVRFKSLSIVTRTQGRFLLNLPSPLGKTVSVELSTFGGSELVDGLRLARVAPDNTLIALRALQARNDVIYAEPNFVRRFDATPNDPHYSEMYGLKDALPGGPGISAESAWSTSTGNHNIVVGVIDSGIDTGHLDLKDNIFVNSAEVAGNNIDDDGNGFVDDVNGWDFINNDKTVFDDPENDAHGTHVAGTIGARGNNAVGIVGVNWNVQLLPLKAIGPQGGSDANLISAYHYAKMMRERGVNLRVLNNSYGGQGFSQSLRDAIKELGDAGILFVAAAGNETLNNDFVPHYPATFDLPNVISVAASDNFGQFAFQFSNRGGQTVHLAAPGEAILSTTPRGYNGRGLVPSYTETDGSTYSVFNGTSMASPHVAGAAALACSVNPNIPLQQLRASVLFSGDEGSAFTVTTITGRRLNANKTLQAATENDAVAPAAGANFRINSQTGRRVELRWNESGDDGSVALASFDEIRFTDASTGEQFNLNYSRPSSPGTERVVFVSIPVKHANGQVTLRTYDNVGNTSTVSVSVTIAADVADPYIVSLEAPTALTALNSGSKIGVKGDDVTFDSVILPFFFTFFGFTTNSVAVSSNGALYIPIPPDFALPHPNVGGADGAIATRANLDNLAMVAGMWADLRTDRNASDDVYLVQPDRDRVIFRWQAVTFENETPANFEVELRRDGTIQTHYGDGNQGLSPVVVGISAGDPDSYIVPTHTSEAGPISLANAQSVTFALRNPPPAPTADLATSVTATPDPLISGQNVTYNVRVNNLGPSTTEDLVMTDVLPAGTTFVSCVSDHIFATCTGPAVGTNGTVTGRISTLPSPPGESSISFTIVARVIAAPGSLQNTVSATGFRPDPNPANNTASVISTVVAESFFSSVRAVSAGVWHTSSVRNDGTVWNWGSGSNGQLGDGNNGIGNNIATPSQVIGLEGFTSISDGNGYVLALKGDGTVWSWGGNGYGQLGDGSTTDRSRPVQTVGLAGVIAVGAGNFYGAALKSDGSVWLWGSTYGLGSLTDGARTTPMQLTGITNVTAIAAGLRHLLMLKSDKTVWAVGANDSGELGDGTTTLRPFPVQVSVVSNIHAIAAGNSFSLALKEDGNVWAWGTNFHGELGPGGGPNDFAAHPSPLQVTGLPAGIQSIATGDSHCLALGGDSSVWSWGNNGDYQLGQGSQVSNNPTPRQIPNFGGVIALDGGLNHSVALKSDGSVWTWGNNTFGQLGEGSNTTRLTPTQVSGLETVSAPAFNPPGSGLQRTPLDVTITCATPGATIRYTLNNTDPTESDPIIASGATVHIEGYVFLRARAWKPGSITSAITIALYDATLPSNPIDTSLFFVTQHYQDFLSRQPDASGLNFWVNNIEGCGLDTHCRDVKRTDTSAAFFLSIEFQETGYLVHRVYKVAFGNLLNKPVPLTLQQFTPDLQQLGQGVVVGQGDWRTQIENNKRAYLDQFVQRAAFLGKYPNSMTPSQFVDSLNDNTEGALTQLERDALVSDLNGAVKTRAEVLRAVAENSEVNRREFNRAFVLMQYFGYLRRDPDSAPDTNFDGYNFWLTKLNQFNGDFRNADMVRAFIVSGEYRHRFGP